MRLALLSLGGKAWKLFTLPLEDGRGVSFAGAALGFLRRPVQAAAEKAADMVVVVANAKVTVMTSPTRSVVHKALGQPCA